ncbi:hypothetical protein QUF50_02350 [Thiotrichales bacterium HSG1]|nr:hypothetical protein [Thiotrichales bacterium HSG1]
MTDMTKYNVVGFVATTAVLCYSAFGEPISQNNYHYSTKDSVQQYQSQYDYYTLSIENSIPVSEQIAVLHKFSSSILNNIKDIDPEFSALVDDKFWDLI